MRRQRSRFAVISAIAVLVACGDGVGIDLGAYDLDIQPDKLVYSLASDSFAYVTLANRSERPVHLPMSIYVVYERLVGDEWRDPRSWFIVDGVGRTFPVPPEESLTDRLELWFYLADKPGTYRFQYYASADTAAPSLLPLPERVSRSFQVTP